jgi:hypothetical protein
MTALVHQHPAWPQQFGADRLHVEQATVERPLRMSHHVPDVVRNRNDESRGRHAHRRKAVNGHRLISTEQNFDHSAGQDGHAARSMREELRNAIAREHAFAIEQVSHNTSPPQPQQTHSTGVVCSLREVRRLQPDTASTQEYVKFWGIYAVTAGTPQPHPEICYRKRKCRVVSQAASFSHRRAAA